MRIVPRHNVNVTIKELAGAIKAAFTGSDISKKSNFEKHFSQYAGIAHSIAVPSARAGLYAALKAIDLRPGNQVIIPEYTFHIVPSLIQSLGGEPVLADCDEYFAPGLEEIKKRITKKTKAVIMANLYGGAGDLGNISAFLKSANIPLILDNAHGCGTLFGDYHLGAWGDIGVYSLGTGKNLVCMGGGMATTMNEEYGRRIRQIADSAPTPSPLEELLHMLPQLAEMFLSRKEIFRLLIYPVLALINDYDRQILDNIFLEKPSKPSDMVGFWKKGFGPIASALGHSQLKKLDWLNERRIERAKFLNKALKNIDGIKLKKAHPQVKHTYLCYAVGVNSASETAKKLLAMGVDCRNDYVTSLMGKTCDRYLYLPNHPMLSVQDMKWVIRCLKKSL